MIDFKQRLIDDFVAVQMDEEIAQRIKLPDWQRYLKGTVVAVGPGRPLYMGERGPMECKVGDRVTFAPTAGMDTEYGVGNKIRLMHDVDVDTVEAA